MNDMEKDLAKIGEAVIEKASKFLEKILIPPFKELDLLSRDQVKYWRWRNQIRILRKTEQYLKEKKIKPGKVPLKTLVPLLEYASLEEESYMQQRWIGLLVRAIDPSYALDLTPTYGETLRQLLPIEAMLVDELVDCFEEIKPNEWPFSYFEHTAMVEVLGISADDYAVMAYNLEKLNLVRASYSLNNPHAVDLELTGFAFDFVKHCRLE